MFNKLVSRFCQNTISNRFGQGSILKMKVNTHHQINLITTWEDHSELKLSSKHNYHYIEDDQKEFKVNENQLECSQNKVIDCLVPEYSGIDIQMNTGTINYVKKDIDSKMYGDVKLIQQEGTIVLNKVKSQYCEIDVGNGLLQFNKYLESQDLKIDQKSGEIYIKRLGITRKGVLTNSGKIMLGALYSQTGKQSKQIDLQTNIIDQFKNQVSDVDIKQDKSLVQIANLQCNCYIEQKEGVVNIENIEAGRVMVNKLGSGNINIHINQVEQLFIISNDQVEINLDIVQDLKDKINIYSLSSQKYIEKTENPVCQVYLDQEPSSLNIKYSKPLTFMEKLQMAKQQRLKRQNICN